MKNAIQLSDHFNFKRLIRFTLPSILMMIFTSIYGVVDGFFVSNFVGKTPFAAVNFIMPFLMVVGAMGFMFGTGGSALIAKTMGEGDNEKANKIFSLLICATIVSGVVISIISNIFIRQIASFLGADGEMLNYCVKYARVLLISLPFLMLQYAFSSLVVTAEKPRLGLALTITAGIINMVGDALFIAVFKWGIVGAAMATALGEILGGIVPLIYFAKKNSSKLRFCKPKWDGKSLVRICTNGSSELMSNISMSLVGMLYNAQLMKYAGENGISAYGTIMYVNFIFLAVFIGYSTGVAPINSYHYGAGNKKELNNILKRSSVIIAIVAVAMFGISEFLATPLASIFVGYDKELLAMTTHAFRIYGVAFLFSGFSIFGSSFFTALNDGLTSAIIAFMRTLIFQCSSVLIMPIFFGLDGIWCSVIVAESLSVMVTIFFLAKKNKKFGYWGKF